MRGNIFYKILLGIAMILLITRGTAFAVDPTITSYSPTSGPSCKNISFQINGSNFQSGVQVRLTNASYTFNLSVTFVHPFGKFVNANVPPIAPEIYTLEVRNPGGNWVQASQLYSADGTTTISSFTPTAEPSGGGTVSLMIDGSNFCPDAEFFLENGMDSVKTTISGNVLPTLAWVTIPAGIMPGDYNVVVRNPYDLEGISTSTYAAIDHLGEPVFDSPSTDPDDPLCCPLIYKPTIYVASQNIFSAPWVPLPVITAYEPNDYTQTGYIPLNVEGSLGGLLTPRAIGELEGHPNGKVLYAGFGDMVDGDMWPITSIGNDLAVIDVRENRVVKQLRRVVGPDNHIVVDSVRDQLYVAMKSPGTTVAGIRVFDITNPYDPVLTSTIRDFSCLQPAGLGLSVDGTKLYFACKASSSQGNFYVVDPDTEDTTLTGTYTWNSSNKIEKNSILVHPNGNKIYVLRGTNRMEIFDGMGNFDDFVSLPAGISAEGAAITPDGSKIFIVDADDGRVVVDTITNNVTSLAGNGFDIAINGDGTQVFSMYDDGAIVSKDPISNATIKRFFGYGISNDDATHMTMTPNVP